MEKLFEKFKSMGYPEDVAQRLAKRASDRIVTINPVPEKVKEKTVEKKPVKTAAKKPAAKKPAAKKK